MPIEQMPGFGLVGRIWLRISGWVGILSACRNHLLRKLPSLRVRGAGIGKAIARQASRRRGKSGRSSAARNASCSAAADEINQEFHGSCKAYALDVADAEATAAFGKEVVADLGAVSILVNNAGVTRDNLTMRMSPEEWDTVMDTNLKGAFHMVKALQRSLLRQGGARIINISSVIGLMGNAGSGELRCEQGWTHRA